MWACSATAFQASSDPTTHPHFTPFDTMTERHCPTCGWTGEDEPDCPDCGKGTVALGCP